MQGTVFTKMSEVQVGACSGWSVRSFVGWFTRATM